MESKSTSTSSSESNLQSSVSPLNLDEILSLFADFQMSPSLPSSHVFISNAYVDADETLESPPANERRRKYVRLLNGLALLLVTQRAHDVAAITLDQTLADATLHTKFTVAKNDDWTPREKDYHRSFLRILQDTSLKTDQREKLEALVMSHCRAKMLDRAKKLWKAYECWQELKVKSTVYDEATLTSILIFKSAIGMEKDGRSWTEFFSAWFEDRLAPKRFYADANVDNRLDAILETHAFCDTHGLLKTLQDVPMLGRRLKKLAAYSKTIDQVIDESRHPLFKRDFSIEYVPSSKAPLLRPVEPPLTLLNRFVTSQGSKMEKFVPLDLQKAGVNLGKINILADTTEQEGTIHCECALALYLLSKANPRATIEIGVSKRSCWPCLLFLHFLAVRGDEVMVASSHHKTYRKWAFPDIYGLDREKAQDIHQSLSDIATRKLKSWVRRSDRKRLSDSSQGSDQPASSRGADTAINRLRLRKTKRLSF